MWFFLWIGAVLKNALILFLVYQFFKYFFRLKNEQKQSVVKTKKTVSRPKPQPEKYVDFKEIKKDL